MGIMDLFSIKSRDQEEKEREIFQNAMFPFGAEQRTLIEALLREIFSKTKIGDTELMFTFLTAKEDFLKGLDEEKQVKACLLVLKRQTLIPAEYFPHIVAMVKLDAAITSLDEYPTITDIHRVIDK